MAHKIHYITVTPYAYGGIANHRQLDCLFNSLLTMTKISKLRITGLLWRIHQKIPFTLQWRHNGRDCVSNHQPHDCLLKRLFMRKSKKASKPRVTGLCQGNSPVTGEFPAQMASNAENVSIWWRHHDKRPVIRKAFFHIVRNDGTHWGVTHWILICKSTHPNIRLLQGSLLLTRINLNSSMDK